MIEEHNHKHCWCKYIGLFAATLVGAFLAFYFVADMTMKHMMDPMYQMNKMDKMMQKEARIAEKIDRKMMRGMGMPMHKALVVVDKTPTEYKIIIDLKQFDNDADDVDVSVDNDTVTITGEIEKEKRNEERIMKYSQTFYLDEKVDKSKMSKKVQHGNLIVILPIKTK